jgi:hypothetical protein
MQIVNRNINSICKLVRIIRHLRIKNNYVTLLPSTLSYKYLDIFDIKIIFLTSNLIIKWKHMIKLKSNILLNKTNNLLGIIILRATPNNNLKHVFQFLEKSLHLIPKTNIYFQFLIKKESVLPWKFLLKNTCFKHTSIKRYNNCFLINLFFIL